MDAQAEAKPKMDEVLLGSRAGADSRGGQCWESWRGKGGEKPPDFGARPRKGKTLILNRKTKKAKCFQNSKSNTGETQPG